MPTRAEERRARRRREWLTDIGAALLILAMCISIVLVWIYVRGINVF
jgi:type VI protein secretion system component VasK